MAFVYDQSGYAYDAPIVTYDEQGIIVTIGIGCKIASPAYKTIQIQGNIRTTKRITCRADIQNRTFRSILINANIKGILPVHLLIQARISQRNQLANLIQARIFHLQKLQVQARIPFHMQVQARIAAPANQTIGIGARAVSTLRQTTVRAFIGKGPILIQARISRRQGFPVIDPSSPAYPLFQPTQLIMKASITNNAAKTVRSVQIGARINPTRRRNITIGCRVGKSSQLTIQANIVPRIKGTVLSCTFNIAGTYQTLLTGTFAVTGVLSPQSLGIGCRIARLVTKKITGHFTIPGSPTTGPVNVISTSSSGSSRGIMNVGAFIS